MTRPALFLTAILSVLVALASFRFLAVGLETAFPGFGGHLGDRRLAFLLHVLLGPIALAAGAAQFFPTLRAARPSLHRWTGRIYVAACFVAGAAGLWLALHAVGGPVAAAGFALLAMAWIGTTAQAFRHALARDFARHRRWMIRSFALTFAAVTLRLQMPGLFALGLDYPAASVILSWSCWIPNLLVAEWLARRPSPAPRRLPLAAQA